jgi:hypothetical protein
MGEDEQILSMDYNHLTRNLVYGGKKSQVVLIDSETLQFVKKYEKGDSYCHGHTNRIFKVKSI